MFDEREDVKEVSLMDGRRWDFRRLENQPRRVSPEGRGNLGSDWRLRRPEGE